jgi:Spx/MgsR family transcriptional regulator
MRPWARVAIDPGRSELMIESYIYASCTSCRKTEEVLKESGTAYERRDFFRDRFTRDELAALLARVGLAPSDVLSRRSKVYKADPGRFDSMSNEELLTLMIEEPTLLRRPLVIHGDEAVIGHNPTKLSELIATNE